MTSLSELWLIDFGEPYPSEPAHARPALILGPPHEFGERFPFVIVAPLTSTARGISLHVEIEPTLKSGLASTSYVQVEAVRSIAKSRLVHRIGSIDTIEMRSVRVALARLLSFDARFA